jgi:hypothetical protein
LESLWKHRVDSSDLLQLSLSMLTQSLTGFDNALGVHSVESVKACEYIGEVLLQSNLFLRAVPYCRRVYAHFNGTPSKTVQNPLAVTHQEGVGSSLIKPLTKSQLRRGFHGSSGGGMLSPVNRTLSFGSPARSKLPSSRGPSSTASPAPFATASTSSVIAANTTAAAAAAQEAAAQKVDERERAALRTKYGPLHVRTAEAAYRLATVLENCVAAGTTSNNGSSDEDVGRHLEAANLFAQAQEAYRIAYEAAKTREAARKQRQRLQWEREQQQQQQKLEEDRKKSSKNEEVAIPESSTNVVTSIGSFADILSLDVVADDEEENDETEVSLAAFEYYDIMQDCLEQHLHAMRRSQY